MFTGGVTEHPGSQCTPLDRPAGAILAPMWREREICAAHAAEFVMYLESRLEKSCVYN